MENALVEFLASFLGSFVGYLAFTRVKLNYIEVRMQEIEVKQLTKQRKLEELDKDIQKLHFGFENLSAMIKIVLTKLQTE